MPHWASRVITPKQKLNNKKKIRTIQEKKHDFDKFITKTLSTLKHLQTWYESSQYCRDVELSKCN